MAQETNETGHFRQTGPHEVFVESKEKGFRARNWHYKSGPTCDATSVRLEVQQDSQQGLAFTIVEERAVSNETT
jgi:hypothetical protein